jgi:hypothetical protein
MGPLGLAFYQIWKVDIYPDGPEAPVTHEELHRLSGPTAYVQDALDFLL